MDELIAKLEAATEGSMGLSREIARAVGWVNAGNSKRGEWVSPDNIHDGQIVYDSLHGTELHRDPPDFTRSLSSAMTLLDEQWEFGIVWDRDNRTATVGLGANALAGFLFGEGNAKSLNREHACAMATCVAVLKARARAESEVSRPQATA